MATVFPDNSRQTGVALEETYRFLLWLMPTVEKFPRNYKFVLGDRSSARLPPTPSSRAGGAAIQGHRLGRAPGWTAASLRSSR